MVRRHPGHRVRRGVPDRARAAPAHRLGQRRLARLDEEQPRLPREPRAGAPARRGEPRRRHGRRGHRRRRQGAGRRRRGPAPRPEPARGPGAAAPARSGRGAERGLRHGAPGHRGHAGRAERSAGEPTRAGRAALGLRALEPRRGGVRLGAGDRARCRAARGAAVPRARGDRQAGAGARSPVARAARRRRGGAARGRGRRRRAAHAARGARRPRARRAHAGARGQRPDAIAGRHRRQPRAAPDAAAGGGAPSADLDRAVDDRHLGADAPARAPAPRSPDAGALADLPRSRRRRARSPDRAVGRRSGRERQPVLHRRVRRGGGQPRAAVVPRGAVDRQPRQAVPRLHRRAVPRHVLRDRQHPALRQRAPAPRAGAGARSLAHRVVPARRGDRRRELHARRADRVLVRRRSRGVRRHAHHARRRAGDRARLAVLRAAAWLRVRPGAGAGRAGDRPRRDGCAVPDGDRLQVQRRVRGPQADQRVHPGAVALGAPARRAPRAAGLAGVPERHPPARLPGRAPGLDRHRRRPRGGVPAHLEVRRAQQPHGLVQRALRRAAR